MRQRAKRGRQLTLVEHHQFIPERGIVVEGQVVLPSCVAFIDQLGDCKRFGLGLKLLVHQPIMRGRALEPTAVVALKQIPQADIACLLIGICRLHSECTSPAGQGSSWCLQSYQFISKRFGGCSVAQAFARRGVQALTCHLH